MFLSGSNEYVENCNSYETVIYTWEQQYVKTPNEIFARRP